MATCSPGVPHRDATASDLPRSIYGLGLGTYRLTCGTLRGHEGSMNGTASIAPVSEEGSDAVVVALNPRDGTDPRMSALADDLLYPALQSSK